MKTLSLFFLIATGLVFDLCGANSAPPSSENLNACAAVEKFRSLAGQEIKVHGLVQGFHYLIMSDESCPAPGRSIYLNIDYRKREQLIEHLSKSDADHVYRDGNFRFSATIQGVLDQVDLTDERHPCFVPNGLISKEIVACLKVSSILEIDDEGLGSSMNLPCESSAVVSTTP